MLFLSLFSIHSFAAIPPEQKSFDVYDVMPVAPEPTITEIQIAAIIPTDIPNGASGGMVGKMVIDRTLKSALKSEAVKSSSIGEVAQDIKDGVGTEMALGAPSNDPDAIQHKVKFKLDPLQTRAKIQYSGIINASTSYQHGDVIYEISENFNSYQVNISHKINDTEDLSLVQVQWGW